MNRYSTLSLTLSVVCFAVIWGINEQFLSLVSVEERPYASQVVRFISAVGLFAFLYQFFIWMSHAGARRWLSDESKLAGEWFQVFRIHNYTKSEEALDAIRHGRVSIDVVGGVLEITATNEKLDHVSAPSTWHSNKVSIQGNQVWLLFSSNGAGRGSTHGNMLFQYDGKEGLAGRPGRLTGQFSDSSPATHYGTIQLYRKKEEYEERLREISEYPGVVTTSCAT